MNWFDIPEVLELVLCHLNHAPSLINALGVNKLWSEMTYNEVVWKGAFASFLPLHYPEVEGSSYNYKQAVKMHFDTKNSLKQNKCVVDCLGYQAHLPYGNKITLSGSMHDNYALIAWYLQENNGSYSAYRIQKLELLDLVNRTVVRKYESESTLQLQSGYLFRNYESASYEILQYTKFDPNTDPVFDRSLDLILNGNYCQTTPNMHPDSPYICAFIQDWKNCELGVIVGNPDTGKVVLNEKYCSQQQGEICAVQVYHSTLFLQRYKKDQILKVDVLTKEQELFPFPECKIGVIGDDVWGTKDKKLFKYNLRTKKMEYKKHPVGGDAYEFRFHFGLVILAASARLEFKDPSDGRHLGTVFFEGYENPTLKELADGTLAALTMRSLQILSFKSEHVNKPVEMLQLDVSGQTQVLNVLEGDLYDKYWKHVPALSAEFFHETETERYSVVFCFLEISLPNLPACKLLTRTKIISPLYRSKIHTRVLINAKDTDHGYTPSGLERSRTACGNVWLVYEQLVDGGWRKSKPADNWQFVLDRLKEE